jgi:hypothetical protein
MFRLRVDARNWFANIRKDLDIDFDVYYICLLAGLAARRKERVAASDTTDLVPHFPSHYRSYSKLVIGLFLSVELEEMGVKAHGDRKLFHSAVSGLINPVAAHHLTDVGIDTLNRYAHGGYDAITEWFDERPRRAETFLPIVLGRIGTGLDQLDRAPLAGL